MTQDPEQLDALLADYIDGNLAGDALRAAEAHLAADPSLRASVARMMADSEALRALPRVGAPADLSEGLRGHLERDLLLGDVGATPGRARRVSPPVAALAAMLMVGLGLAGGTYWLLSDRPSPFMDVAMRVPEKAADEPATDEAPPAAASRRTIAAAPDRASAGREDLPPEAQMDVMSARGGSSPALTAKPAPALSFDAPPVAMPDVSPTLAVTADPMPVDVAGRFAGERVDVTRRSIVFVVDAADGARVAAAVSLYAAAGTDSNAGARRRDAAANEPSDARPADGFIAGDADGSGVRDNALTPTPAGQAIAADGADRVAVARGITGPAAAALRTRLSELSAGRAIAAYEAPFDPRALTRAVMQAAADGMPTRRPADDATPTTSATAPAATAPTTTPATFPATAATTLPVQVGAIDVPADELTLVPEEQQAFEQSSQTRPPLDGEQPRADEPLYDVFVIIRPPPTTRPTTGPASP